MPGESYSADVDLSGVSGLPASTPPIEAVVLSAGIDVHLTYGMMGMSASDGINLSGRAEIVVSRGSAEIGRLGIAITDRGTHSPW